MKVLISRQHGHDSVTIPNGQSASSALRPIGFARGSFVLVGAFTGTSVTYEVSQDGVTWFDLYNAGGTEVTTTVSANCAYPLPTECFDWGFVRFVSNSAEGAERTILVMYST